MLIVQVTPISASSINTLISQLVTATDNPLKSLLTGGNLNQKNAIFQSLADGLNQLSNNNFTGESRSAQWTLIVN